MLTTRSEQSGLGHVPARVLQLRPSYLPAIRPVGRLKAIVTRLLLKTDRGGGE